MSSVRFVHTPLRCLACAYYTSFISHLSSPLSFSLYSFSLALLYRLRVLRRQVQPCLYCAASLYWVASPDRVALAKSALVLRIDVSCISCRFGVWWRARVLSELACVRARLCACVHACMHACARMRATTTFVTFSMVGRVSWSLYGRSGPRTV